MKEFSFVNAPDVETALELLATTENAYLVAGATNVMLDIRSGSINEKTLINIGNIAELRGITMEGDKIRIGALTKIADLADSKLLAENAPALFQAANSFADPTTRNSATIGGNNADASPAADTAPPLMAYQADVIIRSKDGERVVPMEKFYCAGDPGVPRGKKIALEANEMIIAFEFKANPNSAFYKLGRRKAMAISMVSIASSLKVDADGKVTEITVAAGSVAAKVIRCYNTEAALLGKNLHDADLAEVIEKAILSEINPRESWRTSREYRLTVTPELIRRVVLQAADICACERGAE